MAFWERWEVVVSAVMLIYFVSLSNGFKDQPPRYNYDDLPRTSFSCKGKVPGRYYADAETDCQMFHVCVKMSSRGTNDFKFLCPNGTTFDQEHQVCMDYYQVVCHENIGTNPLGHIFELMKLSSPHKNPGLDVGKYSFIDPDFAEKNTLGDDFQVDEYNNNRLATKNNLNYQQPKSHNRKAVDDIFFKSFSPRYTPTTTTTTTTTPAPVIYRNSVPADDPKVVASTPRRPSLETYESYEIESVAGLSPQNSFGAYSGNDKYFDFYDSEVNTGSFSKPYSTTSTTTTTTTTTTPRPRIFHNTYRTPFPVASSTVVPQVQTFQQQASRFNEDFFRKLPSSTEKSVSKAAQFYIHSSTNTFSTPEAKQPYTNPFIASTTEISFSKPIKTKETSPVYKIDGKSFKQNPFHIKFKSFPSSSSVEAVTVKSRGLSNRRPISSSTPSPTTQAPNSFNQPVQDKFLPENAKQAPNYYRTQEEVIRPKSFSGNRNLNQFQPNQGNRDNFGFSTAPTTPSTTQEPITTTTTEIPNVTQDFNNDVTYFQRITTVRPEKFSIFFGKETTFSTENSDVSSSTTDYEQTSTLTPLKFEEFGRKSTYIFSNPTTTTQPTSTLETTTYQRPSVRRGSRRRVTRPRQQSQKVFNPESKYIRRFEANKETPSQVPTARKVQVQRQRKSRRRNQDEIFKAEASVFPGTASGNAFQPEEKPESNTKPTDSPRIAGNFGRKVRVNSRRRKILQHDITTEGLELDSTTASTTETATRRIIVKRLKKIKKRVKAKQNETSTQKTAETSTYPVTITTTTTDFTTPAESTTPQSSTKEDTTFATNRPIKKIKTKIARRRRPLKNSEFKVSPAFFPSRVSKRPATALDKLRKIIATTTSTTTTQTPLVSFSHDKVKKPKLNKLERFFEELSVPTTYKPVGKNSTSVVVKISNNKPSKPASAPISFKEPILTGLSKKETKVEVTHSVSEESTRSPDYDYAYYNTDDDYAEIASKLEHKNYGKKPVEQRTP